METPSSNRRVTRSQAANSSVSKKSRNEQERSALFDITNDSPIVGVAMAGNLETPSSKKRVAVNNCFQAKQRKTPGSGEALLRGQVKNLLQKVEEEAEISKLEFRRPFLHHYLKGAGIVDSPAAGILLAPTPANTPHFNLSGIGLLPSVTPFLISQMIEGKKEEENEGEKSMVTRTLFLDFSEKSECDENREKTATDDDDSSSVWSIQANASSSVRDEEEEELVDELCEGMSKICVGAKFAGKHTRFLYNSDGELEGAVEEEGGGSDDVVRLKGLPTPKGKHVRFPDEEN